MIQVHIPKGPTDMFSILTVKGKRKTNNFNIALSIAVYLKTQVNKWPQYLSMAHKVPSTEPLVYV